MWLPRLPGAPEGCKLPGGYLVGYVWPHFPGVSAILQQHRFVLVTVEQLVCLPYLKNEDGRVNDC